MHRPALAVLLVLALPSGAAARTLDVRAGAAPGGTGSAAAPYATIQQALDDRALTAGDTIAVAPGTYPAFAVTRSGTPLAPITVVATGPGVVVDAAGVAPGIKLYGVSNVVVDGLTVRGSAAQGVFVGSGTGVVLRNCRATANAGVGIQVGSAGAATVDGCQVDANTGAGILEIGAALGLVVRNATVSGNGRNGVAALNGDGIQIAGPAATIEDATITGNGDSPLREHGIYLARTATGWLVQRISSSGNAGSDVKASGSGRLLRGLLGTTAGSALTIADTTGAGVTVDATAIFGASPHAVLLTRETSAPIAVLRNVTAQTSAAGAAVFVNTSASLTLQNALLCATAPSSAPQAALWVDAAARAGTIRASHGWFCSADPARRFGWDGHIASRAVFDAALVAAGGADTSPIESAAPTFGANGLVVAGMRGLHGGLALGLPTDVVGTPIVGLPDLGAYQVSPGA